MCRISVVMTVKNGEIDLVECIESVLNQTFNDFEFLIFDDASTDDTVKIIKSYQDSRIQLFKETAGYTGNLNKGIEISRGLYIARMDHDDIMDPAKFATQIEVMENIEVDVCATWVYLFGDDLKEMNIKRDLTGLIENPLNYLRIGNYLTHSSIMIRKEFLIRNGINYEDYFPADDYKLWFEIAKRKGKFYTIPKPLLYYRLSTYQSGNVYAKKQFEKASLVRKEIEEYLQDKQ